MNIQILQKAAGRWGCQANHVSSFCLACVRMTIPPSWSNMTSLLTTQCAIAANPDCAWGFPARNAWLFVSRRCGTKAKTMSGSAAQRSLE